MPGRFQLCVPLQDKCEAGNPDPLRYTLQWRQNMGSKSVSAEERLKAVEERLDKMDKRFDTANENFAAVEKFLNTLNANLDNVNERLVLVEAEHAGIIPPAD